MNEEKRSKVGKDAFFRIMSKSANVLNLIIQFKNIKGVQINYVKKYLKSIVGTFSTTKYKKEKNRSENFFF